MDCKRIYFLLLIFVYLSYTYAQHPVHGGGEYQQPAQVCISEMHYDQIRQQLYSAEQLLEAEGKLPPPKRTAQAQLSFPLRQSSTFNYPSFYAISNYVDHDINVNNQIRDFNCGTRSYDVASGYNHQGIDYFLWPFDNLMQARNQVEVVAAADGIILFKADGNDDLNCSFCTNCQWNAIYLRHNDGSVTWYGHLKKNSLTSKPIGSSVNRGEYLGVVGSSGISTAPHLHFEVYRSSTYNRSNLIDPYAGPCNQLNGTVSWWDVQPAYYEPRIVRIQTQSAQTLFNTCPIPEVSYEAQEVVQGQTVYFTAYYADQQPATTAEWLITRPDNSVFRSWTQTLNNYYNASWWWWSYTIPSTAPTGEWKFSVKLQGKTVVYPFRVTTSTTTADVQGKRLIIYPNPFNQEFIVDHEKALSDAFLRLTDMAGRTIWVKRITPAGIAPLRIDARNLQIGSYLLTIEQNGKIISRKTVIKK
jgi:hypothetical protein